MSLARPPVHVVKNPDSGSNPGSTIYQLVGQGKLQRSVLICDMGSNDTYPLGQVGVEPQHCPAQAGHSGGADAPSGPQRSWLLRQMELDTAFLQDLNLLDYSFLVASQHLQENERGPGSSLVFRTARWAPQGHRQE